MERETCKRTMSAMWCETGVVNMDMGEGVGWMHGRDGVELKGTGMQSRGRMYGDVKGVEE